MLEKLNRRKKDIMLKVKISFDSDMQTDTGSEVTLIPKYFLECIGKPTLRTSNLLFRQFDGSIIKTYGTLKVPWS